MSKAQGSVAVFAPGLAFALLIVTQALSAVPTSGPFRQPWITDMPVRAMVEDEATGTLYIGGDFTWVGDFVSQGAALDATTGAVDREMPGVGGATYFQHTGNFSDYGTWLWSCHPDGAGGWFIGGNTTHIDGGPMVNLHHILPNKSEDPDFRPDSFKHVMSMARWNNTLFIGGNLGLVNGQQFWGIQAVELDPASADYGEARPFIPVSGATAANFYVYTLVVRGDTLYAGGTFESINGEARNGFAALDCATGAVQTLTANTDSGKYVKSIAVSAAGDYVFLGGNFTQAGGAAHTGVAAVRVSDGNIPTFHGVTLPTNGEVSSLAVSGNTLYLGGLFTQAGGLARSNLAAIAVDPANAATFGRVTAWDGNADGAVRSLAVNGPRLYAAGEFSRIGVTSKLKLAAFTIATGALDTGFDAEVRGGMIGAIAAQGSQLYVAGNYTMYGGVARAHLAAIDMNYGSATYGQPTAWNPGSRGPVYALALSGTTLYAGGSLSAFAPAILVGGQTITKELAAVDTATGALVSAFNPNVSGLSTGSALTWINCIAVKGSTVYAGGSFASAGGQPRESIAALDAASGAALPWNASAAGITNAIVIGGDVVYAGGMWASIGGATRSAADKTIGAVALGTDAAQTTTYGRVIDGFALEHESTSATLMYDTKVNALALKDGILYAGGAFLELEGQARKYLAAIHADISDPATWGELTDFAPQPTVDPHGISHSGVRALKIGGNLLYVAGDFMRMDGLARPIVASFDIGAGPSYGRLTPLRVTAGGSNAVRQKLLAVRGVALGVIKGAICLGSNDDPYYFQCFANAPYIRTPETIVMEEGVPFSMTFEMEGTGAPVWSAVTGLPQGLTFDIATGELSGTPAAGTGNRIFQFEVHAVDSGSSYPAPHNETAQSVTCFVMGAAAALPFTADFEIGGYGLCDVTLGAKARAGITAAAANGGALGFQLDGRPGDSNWNVTQSEANDPAQWPADPEYRSEVEWSVLTGGAAYLTVSFDRYVISAGQPWYANLALQYFDSGAWHTALGAGASAQGVYRGSAAPAWSRETVTIGLSAGISEAPLRFISLVKYALEDQFATAVFLDNVTVVEGVAPPAPVIATMLPDAGSRAGNTQVLFTGMNLAGAISVTFGGAPAQILSNTATDAVVITPERLPLGAPEETVDVVFTNAGGSVTMTAAFTYEPVVVPPVPAPSVAGLSIGTGSTLGGTSVTISGANLDPTSSVTFGGALATVVSFTASAVIVTTPAHAAGVVDVAVTTPGGVAMLAAAFMYEAPVDPAPDPVAQDPFAAAGGCAATGETQGHNGIALILMAMLLAGFMCVRKER